MLISGLTRADRPRWRETSIRSPQPLSQLSFLSCRGGVSVLHCSATITSSPFSQLAMDPLRRSLLLFD